MPIINRWTDCSQPYAYACNAPLREFTDSKSLLLFQPSSPGSTAHFGRMFRIALRKFKNDDDRHLSGSEPLVAVDLDGQTLQQLYEVRVKSAMGLNH